MSERGARWGLLAIVAVYLALGSIYSFVAPLGEAPDETAHLQNMRYIVEQRRLPRTAEDRRAVGIKSHEPPLYYGLLGMATAWVDVRSLPQLKLLDPERYPRHSLPDEVLINFAPLHTADERWPFRGLVLVWHLARLGSLLLMAATLVVLFAVVREVCPPHPGVALLATAAVALAPQFVYIGSSINNDSLAALLGALVLWLLLRLAGGDTRWRQFLLLGLLLGLGRLTKFYLLALVPEAAIVLLVLAWRRRQARYALGLAAALALSFAIPLPWLLYIQPADPAALSGLNRVLVLLDAVHTERWFGPGGEGQAGTGILAPGRALLVFLRPEARAWAAMLFRSFWGYFGAMTIEAPRLVYGVAVALSGLSLMGWLRILVKRLLGRRAALSGCRELWIPGLQVLAFLLTEAVFFGVMRRLPDTAQARHLYPALAGVAVFLALGWRGLWSGLATIPATAGLAVLLVGLAGYCLPSVQSSARKPLLPVRSTPWPGAPSPADGISLGDGLVLDGVRWTVREPCRVAGTLDWRATQPPASEAVAILEMLDATGAVQAVWAGHPGGSRYPTQAWAAGDHVRQELSWPLPKPLTGQQDVRLRLLREGQEVATLSLPAVGPATAATPAAGAGEKPALALYGPEPTTAQLRDTVLVTWPGSRLQGLVGPDGALWQPLARTAHGDQIALVAGAALQPGRYDLAISGPAPAAGTSIGVEVAGRRRSFNPPAGLQPVGAVLGEAVELVGYSLEDGGTAEVAAGQAVRLRLVWRARRRVERHYTVFTHLVDERGGRWGQQDKLPGQEYSTLFWAPGEVIEDEFVLQVDPAAPAGTYNVAVGLYQALSGQRAPVEGRQGEALGDHLLLGEVRIPSR